jgi:hypothetical protein
VRPEARTTNGLLWCGVVAGPIFVVTALVQVLARSGFDLDRHPLSMLSLGDVGSIQIANFIITGGLVIAGAVGMRQASFDVGSLHPPSPADSTWDDSATSISALTAIGGSFIVALMPRAGCRESQRRMALDSRTFSFAWLPGLQRARAQPAVRARR